jgi:hypothetical protein
VFYKEYILVTVRSRDRMCSSYFEKSQLTVHGAVLIVTTTSVNNPVLVHSHGSPVSHAYVDNKLEKC